MRFLKQYFCFVFLFLINIYFLLFLVSCDQNEHYNKSENEILLTKPMTIKVNKSPIINENNKQSSIVEVSITDQKCGESNNVTIDNKDIDYRVACKDDSKSYVKNDNDNAGSDAEFKLTSVVNEEDDFEENLEEDDNENTIEENCDDAKLSSFVRNFKASSFLPEDYKVVKESMNFNVNEQESDRIYEQINSLNDTFQVINRLLKYGHKLRNNVDIIDTIKYLSSITTDEVYEAKISSECTADLLHVAQAIMNNQLWAWNCEYSLSQTSMLFTAF